MNLSALWSEFKHFFRKSAVVHALYLIFSVITILSIIIVAQSREGKSLLRDEYVPAVVRGEYSTDGGVSFNNFNDYGDIYDELGDVNHLIVRCYIRGGLSESEKLYMLMNYISVSVYINDVIVYVSDENADYGWDALADVSITSQDTLTFDLNTKRDVRYSAGFKDFFENLNKSTKAAIISKKITENLLAILGDFVLCILGSIMIMYGVQSRHNPSNGRYGLLSCGIATILGAMTCFFNPEYITLLFPNYELIMYIDSVAQIFSILFVLVYFQRFLKKEEHRYKAKIAIVFAYIIVSIYMLWSSIGYPAGNGAMVMIFASGGLICFYNIWLFVKDREFINDRITKTALYAACFLLICVTIEIAHYLLAGVFVVYVLEFGLIAFAFVQFYVIAAEIYHSRDEAMRLKDAEYELTQAKINVMISQIQPHFLYNAFSTIRALCNKDTEKARDAIDHLARYLRANLDSLSATECVPVSREIENVKSYLKIEQYRFGDKLKVEYDIQTTDFEVPGMTVQTLAENAVKHGLQKKDNGGTLIIRTRETKLSYEVNIIDDGVGFDATSKPDDSREHIGIENTRKRLSGMCGGTLTVESKVSEGTMVTISIPKNKYIVRDDRTD